LLGRGSNECEKRGPEAVKSDNSSIQGVGGGDSGHQCGEKLRKGRTGQT